MTCYLRRFLLLGSLALVLVSGNHAPLFAEFVPRVGVEAGDGNTAYVTVNGRRAIHLRTSNGSLSPARRANIAAGRLAALMPEGVEPKSIWYKNVGRSSRLMVGHTMVVIATRKEARSRGMRPPQVAAMWVRNLRELVAMPPLAVKPGSLTVPLGETRGLTIESLLSGEVAVETSEGATAAIESGSEPNSLVVRGLSVGTAIVKVLCERYEVGVEVAVKKYAASVHGPARAIITGYDPPASLVRRAAGEAARSAVLLEPGASIRGIELPDVGRPPLPGHTACLNVLVKAAGGDHIPARLNAEVAVENRPIGQAPTSSIMYSNFPERVEKYQILFTGRLASSKDAVRLLYHHQNAMGRRIGFTVDVVNASGDPASLQTVEGISEPMLDTVFVGCKAGSSFLRAYQRNVGRVVELPAETRRVVVSQALDPGHTASGIVEFRQLSGDPLLIRVVAKPEAQRLEEDRLDMALPAAGFKSLRLSVSDHIYPRPWKSVDAVYTVGKPWTFLRLGKDPLKHPTLDRRLHGNYGVVYDINAIVENPTSAVQTIELVFEATAGEVSGVFAVEGQFIEIRRLKPPSEEVIHKFVVPAGRDRTVSIRTMPLSGSAYPATLIVRSRSGAASAVLQK